MSGAGVCWFLRADDDMAGVWVQTHWEGASSSETLEIDRQGNFRYWQDSDVRFVGLIEDWPKKGALEISADKVTARYVVKFTNGHTLPVERKWVRRNWNGDPVLFRQDYLPVADDPSKWGQGTMMFKQVGCRVGGMYMEGRVVEDVRKGGREISWLPFKIPLKWMDYYHVFFGS